VEEERAYQLAERLAEHARLAGDEVRVVLTHRVPAAAEVGRRHGGEPVLQQAVSDDQGAYVLADLYPGQRILTVNTISGGVAIDEKPLLIVSAQAGGDDTVDFGWAAGSVAGGPRPQAEQAPNCADDRLTVRFRPETAPGVIDSIFARQHLTLRRYNAALRSFVMTSAPGRAGAAVADLNRLPEVEHATLDCLVAGDSIPAFVPNDPDYNDPSKVYGPQIIDAPAAWDYGFGAGVVVAVVDTGIAMTHTEFISPTNRILPGWNFVADPENNNVQDDNGHGTHVAGIALAVGLKFKFGFDDSLDVVGVHLVGGLVGVLIHTLTVLLGH